MPCRAGHVSFLFFGAGPGLQHPRFVKLKVDLSCKIHYNIQGTNKCKGWICLKISIPGSNQLTGYDLQNIKKAVPVRQNLRWTLLLLFDRKYFRAGLLFNIPGRSFQGWPDFFNIPGRIFKGWPALQPPR